MQQLVVYLIIVTLSLSSCNYFVDIQPPEVVRIYPANRSFVSEKRPPIYVEFSESMDKPKTEEAFTITGDHQPRGHFRWDNDTLYFDLIEDLNDAGIYTITIHSSAEDSHGNNLKEDCIATFSIGNDVIKPEVLSIQPADATLVSNMFSQIIVQFSEPVRLDTVKKGFALSPYVIGDIILQNDNTTLVFTPYNNYIHGTTYSITLSTDITDLAGNPLLKEYRSIFKAGTDFTAPTLRPEYTNPPDYSVGAFADYNSIKLRLYPHTTNEGIDKKATLIITFSKAMQRFDTQKSISFSPSFSFTSSWRDDRTICIIPSSLLALMQTYTLTISTQAKDIAGNTIDEIYNFPIKIYSQFSQPIDVVPYGNYTKFIYQMGCSGNRPDDSVFRILENDDIIENNTNYSFQQTINNKVYNVYILRVTFSNATNTLSTIATLDLPSAMQAISFNMVTTQSDISLTPRIWKIAIPDNHPDCVDIYVFNLTPQSYYRLSISDGAMGINDTLGNYMLSPFSIYLNH